MKGSVTLMKLLLRRTWAVEGSFSSIQPTANILWGQNADLKQRDSPPRGEVSEDRRVRLPARLLTQVIAGPWADVTAS